MIGRGLASLIPKRSSDAKKLLAEIDNMSEEEMAAKPKVKEARVAEKGRGKLRVSVVEDNDEDVQEQTEQPVEKEELPTPEEEEQGASMPVIPGSDEPQEASSSGKAWARHEEKIQLIPVDQIETNPLQPRREFDPIEMDELARSIEHHGILQPLVVRRTPDGFELISGERRLRAAKTLSWEKVPCVVRNDVPSDRTRLELALIENVQRQDLNPIEEAIAFKQLSEEYGMSHDEIGQRVGMSRVAVTNTVRMLQLPEEIQRGLAEGKISSGHARAILMIPDAEKQLRFYHHLIEEGLTVRKAELRARRVQRVMKVDDPLRVKLKSKSVYAIKYNGKLEDAYGYGAKVNFLEDKNRFEVVFTAHNEADLLDLCKKLLDGKDTKAKEED